MIPVIYQVVGEEDFGFRVSIDNAGDYLIAGGTYTSQPPRKGRLTGQQQQDLTGAIEALGPPRDHPLPEGSSAFMASLTLGEEGSAATYSFWEGAIAEDPPLERLVRLLELI